jgi:hypothetical protein
VHEILVPVSRVLGFKMERQTCQKPESGVFSENASFTKTFIDEGEAEADVEHLVFSDDVTFVGDTLELVCNIADNAASTFTIVISWMKIVSSDRVRRGHMSGCKYPSEAMLPCAIASDLNVNRLWHMAT